ncbi:FAD-dependent monooxygenase [Pseudomonas laurentiana]
MRQQDSSTRYDTDVAIIGYGPTGIVSALTLAKHGVNVVAFEREQSIYPRARAVTVNDWTMRIFQGLGIDDRIESVIEAQRGLRWQTYAGDEIMRIMHPPSTLGTRNTKPRFFNIYQPVMEAELRRCADEYGQQLQVNFGFEVVGIDQDDNGVTITSRHVETGEEKTTRARYAIAADGGSSVCRGLLDIPLDGDTNDVTWVVIDCRVKRWWPDRDFLTFWSDRDRPVVDIALSAGNHRWEIPLRAGETPADYPTSKEVWPLLQALNVSEADVEIHQHAFYKHHVRMAETWRRDRVFLAGDAAHLMPPWAGAGMQSGMRDGHDLGWKMAAVIKGDLPETWLDTYETERRPNVTFFTNLAVALGRVIKQEASPEEIEAINRVPEGQVALHESPLVAPPVLEAGWLRGERSSTSIIGRMLPQPIIGDNVGRVARADCLIPPGFVLLGADVDPLSVLSADEKRGWDALGARYIPIRSKDQYTQAPHELVDLDHVILPWMARYGAKVIAVRPDKFVAADDAHGLAVPEIA